MIEARPALLAIDIQKGFQLDDYWGGGRNNPQAEANCSAIMSKWREHNLPVIHIRHSSTNPHSPLHEAHEGFAFQAGAEPQPDEEVVTKSVNSGFIGTNLKQLLDSQGITSLVIIGLTTDHCVSTTTRMAGNYGYQTCLVSDATATFDKTGITGETYPAELIHQTALASLKDEFATIITSKDVLSLFQR